MHRCKGSKVAEQAEPRKINWAIQPLHKWEEALKKLMLSLNRTHITVTDIGEKMDIRCGFHISSSITTLGITKFV
jgi:hypothetical protein